MDRASLTDEDIAKVEELGWALVKDSNPDKVVDMGFLDHIAYIDSLSPAEIGCVVTALLSEKCAIRYPPTLRRSVANALMCWNAGDREED